MIFIYLKYHLIFLLKTFFNKIISQSIYFQNLLITSNIIKRMDQRLYTYDYRRPRYNNPTYISHNVDNSLTYFLNQNERIQAQKHLNNIHNLQKQRESSPIQHEQPKNVQYQNNRQYNNDMNRSRDNIKKQNPREDKERVNSRLSNYGTNILNKVPQENLSTRLNNLKDIDIYKIQSKQYDIINNKPVTHEDTIKKYPKFTLENKDINYYRRMNDSLTLLESNTSSPKVPEQLAGKPAYNQYQNNLPVEFSDKYKSNKVNHKTLKNVDEVYL